MNYVIPTNQPFVSRKPVAMKKKMSPEVAARRKFFDTHTISVDVDPNTGNVTVITEEIHGRNHD